MDSDHGCPARARASAVALVLHAAKDRLGADRTWLDTTRRATARSGFY
jgi:hypothetical protein